VKFRPTHEIVVRSVTPVMLHDGALFTREEWEERLPADFALNPKGQLMYQDKLASHMSAVIGGGVIFYRALPTEEEAPCSKS